MQCICVGERKEINNNSMKGEFQVIDLPETFQLIMGMRFLRRHDCRPILSQRTASFMGQFVS